jgi:hypothetical protein
MFEIRLQMTPMFAEAHIITLRSLLGHFMNKHCADPRNGVSAALNAPIVRKMDPHRYMKADYSLSREDIFFIVFAFWEMLYVENPLNNQEGHRMNILPVGNDDSLVPDH